MRRLSKKRQRQSRAMRQERTAYRAEHIYCMNPDCGGSPAGIQRCDVHEIASGTAGRPLAEVEPAAWLLLCGTCNCDEFTDKSKWPVARQLALKLIMDPLRFDLAKFNQCYTLGSISITDVVQWLHLTN